MSEGVDDEVNISKIYKQIEKLKILNAESNLNHRIRIKKVSNEEYFIGYENDKKDMNSNVNVYLNNVERKKKNREIIEEIPLHGFIHIMSTNKILSSEYDDPSIEAPGKAAGESNSTWYIRKTSDSTRGMGPLLYEVAIEFVSNYLDAGIKPDPDSVSKSAITVWENYLNRTDVIKGQLDINPDDIPYYYKYMKDDNVYDVNMEIKNLTDQTSDDTSQFSAVNHMGYHWHESVLSKTYRKDNQEIIKELEKLNLIEKSFN